MMSSAARKERPRDTMACAADENESSGRASRNATDVSRKSSSNSHSRDQSSSGHRPHHRGSYHQHHSQSVSSSSLPRRNSSRSLGDGMYNDSRSRGSSKTREQSGTGGSNTNHSRQSSDSGTGVGVGNNPRVRMRNRNNILAMHRNGLRRGGLSDNESAFRVLGVDPMYFKDASTPNISDKIGTPGIHKTSMNLLEEQFRIHSLRNSAFVTPLPRGIGSDWHRQYSFFSDKLADVFNDTVGSSQLGSAMRSLSQERPNRSVDSLFTAYLIRNVRRLDDRMCQQWMNELINGKRTVQELVKAIGIPFKQWRPAPSTTKCPLLDYVIKYRPAYMDATWLICVNVIYTEYNEIKRDYTYRVGDWFLHPRRLQRRSHAWTELLIEYLHQMSRSFERNISASIASKSQSGEKSKKGASQSLIMHYRHGEENLESAPTSAVSSSHNEWSYLLKLTEFQHHLGLLDSMRYIEGLVSLFQKMLMPRARNGFSASLLAIGVNEGMELMSTIQSLMPTILESSDHIILLIKSILQHLHYLLPPDADVPDEFDCVHLEECMTSLCHMLRTVVIEGFDVVVRLNTIAPSTWPKYVFSARFFNHSAMSHDEIAHCLEECKQKCSEIAGRIIRLHQSYPSLATSPSMRNEAQVLQNLDRFHRVDSSVDIAHLYDEVFVPLPPTSLEVPVDIAAVFLVCEWAVTSHRPAEYRYLTTISLLEMHNHSLLEYGKRHGLLKCSAEDHQVLLQDALQNFLKLYQPKAISEVSQIIEMFCLLVRRRVFSVDSFVDFLICYIEEEQSLLSSCARNAGSASMVLTAFNIECRPGKGYKASDITLLSTIDRLRLYLWQFSRGCFPLPMCLGVIPDRFYEPEVSLLNWLEVMDLRSEDLLHAKTLERAQSLCVFVFHTHSFICENLDAASKVMREVEYQGKVSELVSAVKTMCGHDKGRFTLWFLRKIYDDTSFFRVSEFASVEHTLRMVCLILEIVDTLALLEVLVFFLRRSPAFLVKNVVLAMIERHEVAYCATGQIHFVMQGFVDRFNRIPGDADDKAGNVAKFFCKMYYAHAKNPEIGKLDLPFALLRPIAETARKNQDVNGQKAKDMSLEIANPLVRIPPPREQISPDLKAALSMTFKALQGRSGNTDKQTVGTPQSSFDGGVTSLSVEEDAFEGVSYASFQWQDVIGESNAAAEKSSRDAAVDFGTSTINACMTSNVATTGANATRERRTPNYVFFLRAVLSEVMDKWMASISARMKNNCRRLIMTPHYIHRCVRLIREVVEQHPEGEEFQEKFSNTLLVWLQKEVLPGFSGSETAKKNRNPFVNFEMGKETFALNQKGRLDKVQYGLKAFLISLVVHKVIDLSQVLRLVLVPLFPRLRRASRDPPPNLPSQLLAMALVFQLFSEPPQNVFLDQQKHIMFDEPVTKYHLRFLRTQVPICLMFPLVHLLCQISYQMEDNFMLRKREERGTLASITLFNLTSDLIVREIIFFDTREAREKHIKPFYQKKQWHTAVLLTHFFRPPNSPAEDANGQVQVLKVDQIVDQMNVWVLNRGGSIYLDLQMSRQQQKAKRVQIRRSRDLKRKSTSDAATRANKRSRVGDKDAAVVRGSRKENGITTADGTLMDATVSSSEEEIELETDNNSSAMEIVSNLIVLRVLKKSARPPLLASPSLCSVSPLATPHLYSTPIVESFEQSDPTKKIRPIGKLEVCDEWAETTGRDVSEEERWMLIAARETEEAAIASLYSATVCSISRKALGSVMARILLVLEDDVNYTTMDTFCRKFNGRTVVRLLCSMICATAASAHQTALLPRHVARSLAVQLEWIFDGCRAFDCDPSGFSLSFVRRLRRKLAIRLQLVAVLAQSKHLSLTVWYRERIVKSLFALLGTSVVSSDVGLTLFSWILDIIPVVNSSILHEKQFELVESLDLPADLKRRVRTVLPRAASGSRAAFVVGAEASNTVVGADPWGLLAFLPGLPSDELVSDGETRELTKGRRVFRSL